jgi:signal peptidase II
MRRFSLIFRPVTIVLGLIVLDQVFKSWIFRLEVSPCSLICFSHYQNSGFAFSLPLFSFLLWPVLLLALLGLLYLVFKNWQKSRLEVRLGMLLVLSGALSNIGERMVLGFVRDPFQVFMGFWNVADAFILVGVIIWWYYTSKTGSD